MHTKIVFKKDTKQERKINNKKKLNRGVVEVESIAPLQGGAPPTSVRGEWWLHLCPPL
jgi:hypothetical protein